MNDEEAAKAPAAAPTGPTLEKPLRRVRYRGRNPRYFREKYKEFQVSIAEEVNRPSGEEKRENPRSSSAKLRFAVRR